MIDDRELKIVIRAEDEFSAAMVKAADTAGRASSAMTRSFEDLVGAAGNAGNGVSSMEERYRGAASAARDLSGTVGELNVALSSMGGAAQMGEKGAGTGLFWLFSGRGEEYNASREDFINNAEERIARLTGRRIDLAAEEFSALSAYDRLHEKSLESRENVSLKVYGAMEDQLLRLVEVHKFSVKGFGDAIARQVKIEMVGLAAKAGIWAVYETAMGFKDLAVGSPTAGLHFKSAAEFAAVAGGAMAVAAGVQSAFFGGKTEDTAKKNGASAPGGPAAAGLTLAEDVGRAGQGGVQHITVNINNPLSEQNWQEIAENNIAPALADLKERNVTLTLNV